ncbi:MAG: pantoate--beta-alanine ligase [Chitinispirillia bacterium]|nr:pantoate--beta-alanine ligase [Chitinispirillia bacterium]MCL2242787.1 pantoate--beta-alanine ligase [Chitinispirillia bacterium]
MKIITTCSEMAAYSLESCTRGASIGLVPTMGALHCGHLSLLEIAANHCDHTVVSIFVNPAQFGPLEDFDRYPRQLERDCELAAGAGCDVVFAPPYKEIYPDNYSTYVTVEEITASLCGASRPGHFRGVATVVLKLFNIVWPRVAVFGAKDAQQVVVVKRMVEDLNLPVRVVVAPTVREPGGLAMSSRNAYLSAPERADAVLINRALESARGLYNGGERDGRVIKGCIGSVLGGGRLISAEYIEVVDTVCLKPLEEINRTALVAVACRMAGTGTRLIDNIVLGGDL